MTKISITRGNVTVTNESKDSTVIVAGGERIALTTNEATELRDALDSYIMAMVYFKE